MIPTAEVLMLDIIKNGRDSSTAKRSPSLRKVVCSNPGRNRRKLYKQVVTAPLPNAGQHV